MKTKSEAAKPARRAPAKAKAVEGGRVAKEVAKLLLGKSTLSYKAIAERVQARIDGANTTPRSVASMATALRHQGHKLPDRRARA